MTEPNTAILIDEPTFDDRGITKAVSAVDMLKSSLRRRILDGDFGPGEFQRDFRMMEEHGTSRHTFRTAAQLLVGEGLLKQIPNRGFFVPDFTPDDIVDITRLRGLLEGEAVRMIILTGTIPRKALDSLEFMRQARGTPDRSGLAAADRDFHRAIVAASGSARLVRSYGALEGEIELLLVQRQAFYDDDEGMFDEHQALVDSLRGRHLSTARDAFVTHWEDLQSKLLMTARPV